MNNETLQAQSPHEPEKQARTVAVYTEKAIANSDKLPREVFKAIKHMNKIELASYLDDVFRSGYKAGYEAGQQSQQKEEGCDADN